MGEILYNSFAKYLSGYLNFMTQKKEWDQPATTADKRQLIDYNYCFLSRKSPFQQSVGVSLVWTATERLLTTGRDIFSVATSFQTSIS